VGSSVLCRPLRLDLVRMVEGSRLADCGGVVDAAEGPGPCGMLRMWEERGRAAVAWSPGHGWRKGSVAGGRG
jgi:hypothetical protein